jgi:transketolase N-terminal domain/subunit
MNPSGVISFADDTSGAMSMAAIGVSLWKYAMKYSPSNPAYFNRDRFVLSNGQPLYPRRTVLWKLAELTKYRPHLSLSVHIYASCWL